MKFGDISIAVIVIAVVMLIIIPLSPAVLDFLLVLNIAVSITILLSSLYMKEPLEMSIFPSLLLITTLFRLALNISSTRLILGNNGNAGEVIKAFGNFVVGGNIVVGFIVFLIIILMQFIVITRGAERVSEVAARFTLDAMPGKQMAIDADLNSGLINEMQAQERRAKIQKEADFYGAMDGASKFVKGDAILSIITTIINCIGGIIIGMVAGEMELGQVVSTYILATVGDGLVNQIPALLISTASGIVVTKASSEAGMGQDLINQLFKNPLVQNMAGVTLILIGLVPGLPKVPMFLLGGLLIFLANTQKAKVTEVETYDDRAEAQAEAAEDRKPENVYNLLHVDPIELEFGYGIIPLADSSQGGDLLDRVVAIRRQCALEQGLIVPVVRLRDNILLKPNEYVIKIKGNEVARGEIMPDYLLAMTPNEMDDEIEGIDTIEPAFGIKAKWISKKMRDKAELMGLTVVDPPSVISTHLTEVVKKYGHELLGRQEVQSIIDTVKETHPSLVEEVVPKLLSVGEVQKVLQNLLKEGISIRDMVTILETLGDYAAITRDTDILTRYVRENLKRTITQKYFPEGEADVITIDPQLEQAIAESIRQTEGGTFLTLSPDIMQGILAGVQKELNRLLPMGISPIILTTPTVRLYLKKIVEQMFPDLAVLSYNEIEPYVQIKAVGVVNA